MPLDTHDYYPYTPGSGCDPEPSEDTAIKSGDSDIMLTETDSADSNASASTPKPVLTPEDPDSVDTPAPAPPGFETTVSHILSWILSPVLMPTYAIITVFTLSMLSYAPARSKWIIVGIVFGLTCVIPCVAVWILTRFGDVSDVALTRRGDRLIPYVITAASLFACGFYLNVVGMPEWVGYFYVGAGIASAVNLLVNFKWKISAHGAGIGGYIAMILVLNRYGVPPYNLWAICLVAIALGGILGAARVWLGRHTPMQTIAGETVGFLCVILTELLLVPPV